MQKRHGWEFLFLGANQDTIGEAAHLGIPAHKAMTFVADSEGTELMFCEVSKKIAHSRKTGKEVEM